MIVLLESIHDDALALLRDVDEVRLTTEPATIDADIPRESVALTISTPLADQELDATGSTGVAYWEGLIDVAGTTRQGPVEGRGYLAMTGYAGSMGRFLSTAP